MKSLYCIRETDGALLENDGTSWSVAASGPVSWPSNAWEKICIGCFVYRGRLFARYRIDNVAYVAMWDGSDMVPVASCDMGTSLSTSTSYRLWQWGSVVNYRGIIVWWGNSYISKLHQFVFRYDDDISDWVLEGRILHELPAVSNTVSGQDNAYSSTIHNQNDPSTWGMDLIPYNDKLALVPQGIPSYGRSDYYVQPSLIDIASPANAKALDIPLYGVTDRFIGFDYSTDYSTSFDIHKVMVGGCEWRGKMHLLSVTGKLWSYDPLLPERWSLEHDIILSDRQSTSPVLAWRPSVTTSSSDYGVYASHSSIYPEWDYYGLGASVWVEDYPEQGVTTRGYCHRQYSSYHMYVQDEDGQPLAASAGLNFTGHWGFGPNTYDSNNVLSTNRFIRMFVHDDKLCILSCPYPRNLSHAMTECPPWSLHVWDGNECLHYDVSPNGGRVQGRNIRLAIDHANELVHVFYYDNNTSTVQHACIDLANPWYATLEGTVDNAPVGSPSDAIVLFDHGDVTARIEGVTVDTQDGKSTIEYKLYSTSSDLADIEIEINNGHGWVAASGDSSDLLHEGDSGLSSSEAGELHVYVHDFYAAGMPDITPWAQYRIRIIDQNPS